MRRILILQDLDDPIITEGGEEMTLRTGDIEFCPSIIADTLIGTWNSRTRWTYDIGNDLGSSSFMATLERVVSARSDNEKQIESMRAEFDGDPSAKVAQNAVTGNNVASVSLRRDLVQEVDFTFSTKLDDWKATNQKSSGRCWLFATLNLFRPGTMKKMNVKEFEFSQAHIHFWDKFERSNHFLEAIIETSDRAVDDRTIHFLLSDPIGDGGQWNMAMNLIRKHGLVPKSAYPESNSSSSTRWDELYSKGHTEKHG